MYYRNNRGKLCQEFITDCNHINVLRAILDKNKDKCKIVVNDSSELAWIKSIKCKTEIWNSNKVTPQKDSKNSFTFKEKNGDLSCDDGLANKVLPELEYMPCEEDQRYNITSTSPVLYIDGGEAIENIWDEIMSSSEGNTNIRTASDTSVNDLHANSHLKSKSSRNTGPLRKKHDKKQEFSEQQSVKTVEVSRSTISGRQIRQVKPVHPVVKIEGNENVQYSSFTYSPTRGYVRRPRNELSQKVVSKRSNDRNQMPVKN